jgi:PAS domain S-box-containing protein
MVPFSCEVRVRDSVAEQADPHASGPDAATLKMIVEESTDCVKLLDLDARLISMNAGGRRTMEIENFDVCHNLLWPEFWQGEDRLRVEAALDLARLGERSSFEGQAATFKGSSRWWAIKISPVFGETGAVERLLAVSRDITAQKRAELALSVLNASLEAQVAARTEELQTERLRADVLATLGDELQQAGTPEEVAARALAHLGPALGAQTMLLIRLDGQPGGPLGGRTLLSPAVWGDPSPAVLADMTRERRLHGAPLLSRAAQERKGVYLENDLSGPQTDAFLPALASPALASPAWASGVEPVLAPDGQLGGFLVVWRTGGPWKPGEQDLMRRAAATIGLALERAIAVADLEVQARSQDAFLAFTGAVGTQTDVPLLAQQATDVLLTFFPESAVSIRASETGSEPRAEAAAPWKVESGEPVFTDRQTDAATPSDGCSGSALTSATLSLLVGGEERWTLSVVLKDARAWVERDRAVVRAVGQALNLALERAEGVRQLSGSNQDLRREQTFLRSVLSSLSEGVVACDEHGQLTLFNEATRRFHGLEASPLPPEDWARHYDLFQGDGVTPLGSEQVPLFRAWKGEQLSEVAMVIRPKNGEARQLLASGQPMFAPDGQQLGAVVTMRDVTERLAAERLLDTSHQELQQRNAELHAANEELEAFTYSASHDLRTPVRHVQSFSQLARRAMADDSPGLAAKHLGVVEKAAEHMTTLIDAMLQLSRSTRANLTLGPVDLNTVVQGVCQGLRQEVGDRQIEWRIGTLAVVWGDETLLRQALGNLLDNAVKFSRTRERALIEVWTEETSSAWSVFVRDNGVGFEAKYKDRLFGVFQRLHTDREFEGTGMGLATVRRVVLRHGGSVTASSTGTSSGAPGEGATFGFTLPRRR